jgi:hypothetical protein
VYCEFRNNVPMATDTWDFWIDENDPGHQDDWEQYMTGVRIPKNLDADGTTYLAGEILLVRMNTKINGVEPHGDGGVLYFSDGDLGGHVIGDIDGSPGSWGGGSASDCGGQFLDVNPFGYETGDAVMSLYCYVNAWDTHRTIGFQDNYTLPFFIPTPDGTPDDFDGDGTPDVPLIEDVPHYWDHLNYDYNGDGTILNNSDPDGDGTLELDQYGYVDTDGDGTADGVPDAWQVDADGDGTLDIVRYLWTDDPLGGIHGGSARETVGWNDWGGAGVDKLYVHALWEVPEPVTVLLTAAGLAGVLGIRRRK